MKRRLLILFFSLILGAITNYTLHSLYSSGHLPIDVSDGDGHGPDYGTAEWQSAARGSIRFHAIAGGVLIGVITFGLGSWRNRSRTKGSF